LNVRLASELLGLASSLATSSADFPWWASWAAPTDGIDTPALKTAANKHRPTKALDLSSPIPGAGAATVVA